LAGGSARDLQFTNAPWQGAWSRNDDILVRVGQDLVRISGQGGAPTPIPNSSAAASPTFLSDGRRFLVRVSSDNRSSIQSGALGSTERTLVVDNVLSAPVLAPTPRGKTYLLLLRESDLTAQEFDEASGRFLGNPVLLVPRIGRLGLPQALPAVGVSSSGILAYQNAPGGTTRRLTWVNRSGLPVHTLSPEVFVQKPRLSPDESKVVGYRLPGSQGIWVTDLVRESSERKTFDDSQGEGNSVWSKDGSRLAFRAQSGGIYTVDVNGGGRKLLTETNGVPTSWWGQHLLYSFPAPPFGKIYMLDLAGDKKPVQVGSPNGYSGEGTFSPDGNYIAFTSDRSGRYEVYVQPISAGAGDTPVSIHGGGTPRWRGDGKEIFFVNGDADLMAVDIKLGNAVSVGTPHKLFRFDSRDGYEVARNGYDVTSDGQRFLIVSPVKEFNSPITVVLNWWAELERRLGR